MISERAGLYAKYVNPDFVELLSAFDYGRDFVRASGVYLYDEAGGEYLDTLAGFGVHNVGHNHPRLLAELHRALDAQAPSMLNIDAPHCRAELAHRLNALTHADLCRTVFANSGAEAVDIALKAARAATGRSKVIACNGGYHGLSSSTVGLIGQPEYHKYSSSQAGDISWVPFNDVDALDAACRRDKPAAFIVEPVQAEGGIHVPAATYLEDAGSVCRKHGVLLVIDEIQTGVGRTGTMFATPFARVPPDVLVLGKALSGGLVPVALAMMTADVWKKSFRGPWACNVNASTFSGGYLAARTAVTVLDIVEQEQLVPASATAVQELATGLSHLAGRHAVIQETRQSGLLAGIEFRPAAGLLMKSVPAWAREGLFSQVICALLLRDHRIVAQPCSLAQNVLRIEPPLTITAEHVTRVLSALDAVLAVCPDHRAALSAAFRRRVFGRAL